MNRLQSEWQRLYLAHSPESTPQASSTSGTSSADADSPTSAPTPPTPVDAMTEAAAGNTPSLVAPGGRVRALVLELGRPADWDALLAVWQGVQADLALPAPAIAVSGTDAYQLWFSVAQAVPVAQAAVFLEGLRQRHLADVAPHRIGMLPAPQATTAPALHTQSRTVPSALPPALRVPAQQPNGHWSAFVTADLARIFADEPWLDLPPNELAQADLLSRMVSIPLADFERACAQLRPSPPAPAPAAHTPTPDQHPQAAETAHAPAAPHGSSATGFTHSTEPTTAGGPWADPRDFLLHVMNDTSVDMRLRIEAARALLPQNYPQKSQQ